MIKAVIFDCFGVLATDELLPFLREYFSDKPALMQEAKAMNARVDAGRQDYGSMIRRLAAMAGISEQAAKARIEHNVPDEQLFAYIRDELKSAYKIGFLSNAGENWLSEIFTPEQINLFDAVLLSHEIGIAKPDPRIYHAMAEKLSLQTAECLMVDDQERYCKGAEAAGMQVILYASVPQLKADLADVLRPSKNE